MINSHMENSALYMPRFILDKDMPEAVWMYGEKIADTFEEFVYGMYHEGPLYCLNFLEKAILQKTKEAL